MREKDTLSGNPFIVAFYYEQTKLFLILTIFPSNILKINKKKTFTTKNNPLEKIQDYPFVNLKGGVGKNTTFASIGMVR